MDPSSLRKLAFGFLLASAASCVPACIAAETGNTIPRLAAPPIYPWSESSDTVRFSKSALSNLSLWGVAMTNCESARTFVLSKQFIGAFLVTEREAVNVNNSLAKALHEYRTVEGAHLDPTDDAPDQSKIWRNRPPTAAEVNYRLTPFPKEASAIRWQLESEVRSALGGQRAALFWQFSWEMLQDSMNTFTREEPAAVGVRQLAISAGSTSRNAPAKPDTSEAALALPHINTFHTFFLRGAAPFPRVDMDVYQQTGSPARGRGASGGGGPYSEELDRYAPISMRPVLAHWRKAISDGTVPGALGLKAQPRKDPSPEYREALGEPTAPPGGDPIFNHPPWDETAEYVDITKSFFSTLRIPALTSDWQLSPEAAVAFGLTEDDQKSVMELFSEMDARLQKLEAEHLEVTDPAAISLVLQAFPVQKAALDKEWLSRLGERIGNGRARLLDKAMKTSPFYGMNRREKLDPGEGSRDFFGSSWLQRGTNTVKFEVQGSPGGFWNLSYSIDRPGGESSRSSGRWGRAPQPFRHLLTTEVLESKLQRKSPGQP